MQVTLGTCRSNSKAKKIQTGLCPKVWICFDVRLPPDEAIFRPTREERLRAGLPPAASFLVGSVLGKAAAQPGSATAEPLEAAAASNLLHSDLRGPSRSGSCRSVKRFAARE